MNAAVMVMVSSVFVQAVRMTGTLGFDTLKDLQADATLLLDNPPEFDYIGPELNLSAEIKP